MNLKAIFNKNKIINFDIIVYLSCLVFIAMGILVSLNRFWQYEVFFYDFGIFDQAIWKVSRFQAPIIDHLVVGGKWIFADHFNPSIFLLSPLYWFTDRSEALLVAQSVVVGLSGIVLYSIGKEVIRNRFLAFSVVVIYFLFIGLQNAIISDFHEVAISTLPLALVFWALVKKRLFLYFFFLFLVLGFKESMFLVGTGIGIFILFYRKEWKFVGLGTIIISLAWGYIAIKIVIPYFSGGIYHYAQSLTTITSVFTSFADNPIKINTLFYSFLSFGFLPLLSPSFWFLILQDFFVRFYSPWSTRWGLGLHYSAQLASIMAIASIFSIEILKKHIKQLKYLFLLGIIMIINSLYLHQFVLHGPLGLTYNYAFYKHSQDFRFLDNVIDMIPRNASSIMTQNNIAVRFTHRNVLLLRNDYGYYKPDYILLDIRGGQNPNNFFGTKNIIEAVEKLKKDKDYISFYETDEQYVFKRINIKN